MEELENKGVVGGRDALLARLKSKYPDKEFDNDDALYEQIGGDYDQYEKDLESYKGREKALSDMFTSDPRSASFLQSWRGGEDPAIALVRLFGDDIREAIDDPEKQEELAQANKEFVERVAQSKELEEQYQTNLAQSLDNLDALQAEMSLSDEDMDKAMELVLKIVSDGVQGKFSNDTIKMALKAMNYEADVESAQHIGEVKGRNAKIDEKLRTKSNSDGMAQLDGGAMPAQPSRRKPMSLFDIANQAK